MSNLQSDQFAAYCLELLGPLGSVRAKKMFGGHGLYVEDVCIALILNEQLYLKADTTTCQAFEAALGQPFVYQAKGRDVRVIDLLERAADDAERQPFGAWQRCREWRYGLQQSQ